MNEKKERKGKKILLSCIAVALVAAISVGSTLALSRAQNANDNDLKNKFGTTSIDVWLIEDMWDGDPDGKDGPNPATNTTDSNLGMNQANKYTSGATINKNPHLYNNSSYDEYVALKLEYYVTVNGVETQVDPDSFIANVGFFTKDNGWYTTDNETFYYGTNSEFKVLDPSANTTNLFSTVKVEAGTEGQVLKYNSTTDYVEWTDLPNFEIRIKGYAVQADNLQTTDALTTKYAVAKDALDKIITANPID